MTDLKTRYLNDVIFHTVVEQMRGIISTARLTPSEVREAAMLACILEEEYRPRKPLTTSDEEVALMAKRLHREPDHDKKHG